MLERVEPLLPVAKDVDTRFEESPVAVPVEDAVDDRPELRDVFTQRVNVVHVRTCNRRRTPKRIDGSINDPDAVDRARYGTR